MSTPEAHTPLRSARIRSPGGRLQLGEMSHGVRLMVRGERSAVARALEPEGLSLPDTPLTFRTRKAVRIAWLGPDEWLIEASPETRLADAAALRARLGEDGTALDLSHQFAAISISGPPTRALLKAGCPIDLDRAAPGLATRTLYGKAEVVLFLEDEAARLLTGRSFARYLWELLRFHATELDPPASEPA